MVQSSVARKVREAKSRKHEKSKAGNDPDGKVGPEARLTEQQKGELMASASQVGKLDRLVASIRERLAGS